MSRAGVTLVEVLVSIFIMGIGMLAILALFPLGALSMARAIRDDRAATLGRNADAIAKAFDLRHDANVTAALRSPEAGGLLDAAPNGPSYPVYLDPLGMANGGSRVGGLLGVARRGPANPAVANATRWFTLNDEIHFKTDGIPQSPLLREALYSYALMMQRPILAEESVVDVSVVVYYRRPLFSLQSQEFAFQGDMQAGGEVSFSPATNTITIRNTAGRPAPIRSGVWLLDCSLIEPPPTGPVPGLKPHAHASFHRAVSVTELTTNTFEIEVVPPLRGHGSPPPGGMLTPRVVIMDGVIDVFEKGTGWKP